MCNLLWLAQPGDCLSLSLLTFLVSVCSSLGNNSQAEGYTMLVNWSNSGLSVASLDSGSMDLEQKQTS